MFENQIAKYLVVKEFNKQKSNEVKEIKNSNCKYQLKDVVIATIVTQFISLSCVSPFD